MAEESIVPEDFRENYKLLCKSYGIEKTNEILLESIVDLYKTVESQHLAIEQAQKEFKKIKVQKNRRIDCLEASIQRLATIFKKLSQSNDPEIKSIAELVIDTILMPTQNSNMGSMNWEKSTYPKYDD
jgi:hypothetical protein